MWRGAEVNRKKNMLAIGRGMDGNVINEDVPGVGRPPTAPRLNYTNEDGSKKSCPLKALPLADGAGTDGWVVLQAVQDMIRYDRGFASQASLLTQEGLRSLLHVLMRERDRICLHEPPEYCDVISGLPHLRMEKASFLEFCEQLGVTRGVREKLAAAGLRGVGRSGAEEAEDVVQGSSAGGDDGDQRDRELSADSFGESG